jgi:hypothetical protein
VSHHGQSLGPRGNHSKTCEQISRRREINSHGIERLGAPVRHQSAPVGSGRLLRHALLIYQRIGYVYADQVQVLPGVALASQQVLRQDEYVHVEEINIGPSEALLPVGSVVALAGKGLQGDRHFFADGAMPGQALTLIEAEALEDVGLTGAQSRRQVVVRGVRLNELVGARFLVGDVECVGVELCEPCLHLQRLTRPGIIKDLIHRAGLNADILTDGQISIGDRVTRDAGAADGDAGTAESAVSS